MPQVLSDGMGAPLGFCSLLGDHWGLTVEGGFGDRVSAMFTLGYDI